MNQPLSPHSFDSTTSSQTLSVINIRDGTPVDSLVRVISNLSSRFRRRASTAPTSPSVSSLTPDLSNLITSITLKDLKKSRPCGSGGYGEVSVVTHRRLGQVAVKKLRFYGSAKDIGEQRRRAFREGSLWKDLEHPHVLPFFGVLQTSVGGIYLVSAYAENGSLMDYIERHPDVDRPKLLMETAAAIAYLHRFGIVHGDIKASNILVSKDTHALLCDFGLARPSHHLTSAGLQGHGTIAWQSPELFNGEGKSFTSDVWAFGMTIYQVLSGKVPYHDRRTSAAVIKAIALDDDRPPTRPTHSPSGISYAPLWGVAIDCWQRDPIRRLSMQAAHDRVLLRIIRSLQLSDNANVVWCMAFSPGAKTIAFGSSNHSLRLWDAETGVAKSQPFTGHKHLVSCVAFSPHGTTVASGSWDLTVRLWDAETGLHKGKPSAGHSDWVSCVAFSPSGRAVASGSLDCSLRLWDADSGEPVGPPLIGHSKAVACLIYSPDGRTIASGSDDGTLVLWDAESGTQTMLLIGHTSVVRCVAFSPDGSTIASGSRDRTIRLWDVETGLEKGDPLKGHTSWVSCLAYSPDGRTIASGSHDDTIRLWDADTGVPKGATMTCNSASVHCVAFSPDGTTITSGSSDCTVRSWLVDI